MLQHRIVLLQIQSFSLAVKITLYTSNSKKNTSNHTLHRLQVCLKHVKILVIPNTGFPGFWRPIQGFLWISYQSTLKGEGEPLDYTLGVTTQNPGINQAGLPTMWSQHIPVNITLGRIDVSDGIGKKIPRQPLGMSCPRHAQRRWLLQNVVLVLTKKRRRVVSQTALV